MKRFTFLFISLMLLCTMQIEAQATVTLGNGTSSSSTRGPFQRSDTGSGSVYSRAHLVYLETELAAVGILPGSTITDIQFDKRKTGQLTATGDAFLKVYMRNTAATEATEQTWSDILIGTTLVGDITYNLANNFPNGQGYMSFPISPFVYTGGTLEIAVDWDSSNLTPADPGQPNRYFDTDNGSITWRWADTGHTSTATRAGTSGPPSNFISGGDVRAERCDIRITYLNPGPPPSGSAVPFWVEDFDGSNPNNPFDFSVCGIINSSDYYGIVCLDGGPCGSADIHDGIFYGGATGSFFGARDLIGDNDAGDPCQFTEASVTSSATGIDISSCPNLSAIGAYICFDIAESDTSTNPPGSNRDQTSSGDDTWDGNQGDPNRNSFVTLSGSVDGGTPFNITSFAAPGGSDSGAALDTNCDGIGEGSTVTSTFTTFCFQLASKGDALDLSLTINGFNTAGEDVAIDNIALYCTDDPTTLPAGVSISCTAPLVAAVPAMGEWALIILGILMIIIATFAMSLANEPALATSSGQSVKMKFKLSNLPFERNLFIRMALIALGVVTTIFAIAIVGFGYELTSADPTGSIIASGLIGYWLMLLNMEDKAE